MAVNAGSKLTRVVHRVLVNRCVIPVSYATRTLSSKFIGSQCLHYSNVASKREIVSLRSFSSSTPSAIDVSYDQLKRVLADHAAVVIDVREPWELREYGNIPGSINVPLGQVNLALQLKPEEFKEKYGGDMPVHADNIVFTCLAGVRSKTALDTAVTLGYSKVQHYPGGWQDWAKHEILQTKD